MLALLLNNYINYDNLLPFSISLLFSVPRLSLHHRHPTDSLRLHPHIRPSILTLCAAILSCETLISHRFALVAYRAILSYSVSVLLAVAAAEVEVAFGANHCALFAADRDRFDRQFAEVVAAVDHSS